MQGGPLDKNVRYYVSISHPALHFTEKKVIIYIFHDRLRQKRRRGLAEGDKSDGRHVKWIF